MLIFANNLTLFLYIGKIEFLLTGVIQPNMTGLFYSFHTLQDSVKPQPRLATWFRGQCLRQIHEEQ